jgi:dihydrofolate reductase
MGNLIAFEWMSLDGVFDAETMPDWWEPYDSAERQQCIQDVYLHTDAFLMGRTTYEMLFPYWSKLGDEEMGGVAGKLNNTPKCVVSSHRIEADWKNSELIHGSGEDVVNEVRHLKGDRGEIVVIGSATLVQALMAAELVDEFKFLVQPVIAGNGKRFFRDGMNARLQLVESRQLEKGVHFLHYANTPL